MNKILFLCLIPLLTIPTVQAEEFVTMCFDDTEVKILERMVGGFIDKGGIVGSCEPDESIQSNIVIESSIEELAPTRNANFTKIVDWWNNTINAESLESKVDRLEKENLILRAENLQLKGLILELYEKINVIYGWVLQH